VAWLRYDPTQYVDDGDDDRSMVASFDEVSDRAERKCETALSKTDVMILRLLLPHSASSAPWSSPPSLTALRRLAILV